jgi:serine/threonine protein kinase
MLSANRIGEKYEILDVLGRGAMGTVYSGRDVRTGRRVAIKALHVRGALDPADPGVRRFDQEARIAGSLDSEHVVRLLDIDRDPETDAPFLVMELLAGEDLERSIERRGTLPVDLALGIAAQACLGLEAAHAAGVVHRDIKPGNLFLSLHDRGHVVVKILDFGLAKIRRTPPERFDGAARAGLSPPQVSLTTSGRMVGSPLYMSPEQVDGSTGIDARTDVFSLGLTLYTMLAGAPPQRGKSLVEMIHRALHEQVPPVHEVAPSVPARVSALVTRATRLAREDRFPGAAAMREAIQALLPAGFTLRAEMLR